MASSSISSPVEFSFEDLGRFTDDFSDANFIGDTQFGKVYHGQIQNGIKVQEVTVKIWVDHKEYYLEPEEKLWRVKEEVQILQQQNFSSHPNVVKLIGYCSDGEKVGIVYDLKALNTVYNLVSDESFNWSLRIKVALNFARLISFLHKEKTNSLGYLVRNISPSHIILDQEFRPILFDFGMLSGGILPDRTDIKGEEQSGCYGYFDPYNAFPGTWTDKCDVFSFGCVLVGLVCKRLYKKRCLPQRTGEAVYGWARLAYTPSHHSEKGFVRTKCSLVHTSLKADDRYDESDGIKLTKLIVRCVEEYPYKRPTMDEVVRSLLKLRVIENSAQELNLKRILQEHRKGYADSLGLKQIFICARG